MSKPGPVQTIKSAVIKSPLEPRTEAGIQSPEATNDNQALWLQMFPNSNFLGKLRRKKKSVFVQQNEDDKFLE